MNAHLPNPDPSRKRNRIGFMKRAVLVTTSLAVAVGGYVVVVHPASADETFAAASGFEANALAVADDCSDGELTVNLTPGSGDALDLARLPVTLPSGTLSRTGDRMLLEGPIAEASCDVGMDKSKANILAFVTAVIAGAAAAKVVARYDKQFVSPVAGAVAGVVGAYINEGLQNNRWSSDALQDAAFSALQSLSLGAVLRYAYPHLRENLFTDLQQTFENLVGNGFGAYLRLWVGHLNAQAGPITTAIANAAEQAAVDDEL
jgi:uncharacterized membrane protein YeaQ/YmgE (transglycosylase-associated protein family)